MDLLTFATYNIHACIGSDRRFDPQRIVGVINELNADIVALQEVEHHSIDALDMPDYLAEQTGLTAIAGPTLLRGSRGYGNVLLTRLPVLTMQQVDLSLPGHEPRGAIEVVYNCNGLSLQVVASHLGLSPGERRRQIRQLLSIFDARPTDISILLGDLNEWFLWGRILHWLRVHFESTPNYATFPSRWPIFSLDHMWIKPRERLLKLEVHASTLARIASDHLPLKGVVRI